MMSQMGVKAILDDWNSSDVSASTSVFDISPIPQEMETFGGLVVAVSPVGRALAHSEGPSLTVETPTGSRKSLNISKDSNCSTVKRAKPKKLSSLNESSLNETRLSFEGMDINVSPNLNKSIHERSVELAQFKPLNELMTSGSQTESSESGSRNVSVLSSQSMSESSISSQPEAVKKAAKKKKEDNSLPSINEEKGANVKKTKVKKLQTLKEKKAGPAKKTRGTQSAVPKETAGKGKTLKKDNTTKINETTDSFSSNLNISDNLNKKSPKKLFKVLGNNESLRVKKSPSPKPKIGATQKTSPRLKVTNGNEASTSSYEINIVQSPNDPTPNRPIDIVLPSTNKNTKISVNISGSKRKTLKPNQGVTVKKEPESPEVIDLTKSADKKASSGGKKAAAIKQEKTQLGSREEKTIPKYRRKDKSAKKKTLVCGSSSSSTEISHSSDDSDRGCHCSNCCVTDVSSCSCSCSDCACSCSCSECCSSDSSDSSEDHGRRHRRR